MLLPEITHLLPQWMDQEFSVLPVARCFRSLCLDEELDAFKRVPQGMAKHGRLSRRHEFIQENRSVEAG